MARYRIEVPQWFGVRVKVFEVTCDDMDDAKVAACRAVAQDKEIKWRRYWWQIWFPEYPQSWELRPEP